MEIRINNLNEIREAAVQFIQETKEYKVFAFYGNMGVGKTSFIKAVCQELGVQDDINSPTFAIVNEYCGTQNKRIFHFDFYRINDLQEAFDFGYEEYFYSNDLCFIEWPERIEQLLPLETLRVNMKEEETGERSLSF